MKRVSASKVQADLGTYLDDANKEPVVVTRNGQAVAVLVGVTDKDDLERLLLAWSPKLQSALEKSRRQIREGKGIPHDEFWSSVDRMSARATRQKRCRKTARP